MKSLNETYSSSHGNTHETVADLVFCALVVLVLFVVTLAVEVSQRVRASLITTEAIPVVEVVEQIETLTPEEVKELSERLQKQQSEMEAQRTRMVEQEQQLQALRSQISSQENVLTNKLAALAGEQRFTGATEPAVVQMAYDYKKDRFIFVRRKEFDNAMTRKSGESDLAFIVRRKSELVDLALLCRTQRYFTTEETNRIYAGFSLYKQINPSQDSYSISSERMGVSFGPSLSGYIAGDVDLPSYAATEIENAVNGNFNVTGSESDGMYPSVIVHVNENDQTVVINGVTLSAKDFKDVLLAIGGRGVMLDFAGYTGKAPDWLVENVLTPTGYIGKTPKVPSN
jgi:hypothetical protein